MYRRRQEEGQSRPGVHRTPLGSEGLADHGKDSAGNDREERGDLTGVRHHFTIDVEEYFHVSAVEAHLPRSSWPGMESRVEYSTEKILDLLGRFDTVGTFFILGIVAESHPGLVRRIAEGGHEVASHGWDHRRVTDLTPDEFRSQVRRSKTLLEDIAGVPVLGYRAPSFSIVKGREWALSILVEEGYRYDSSLYPVRRRGYGYHGGRRDIHRIESASGPITEVPPATLRLAGMNVPAGGGGTFRQFPYPFTRSAFTNGTRCPEGPTTFYLHPWELDPEQPRIPGLPLSTRLRHYRGLRQAEARLVRLLKDVPFQSIAMTLAAQPHAAGA